MDIIIIIILYYNINACRHVDTPSLYLGAMGGEESGRSSQHFCPSSGTQVAGVAYMQIRKCCVYESHLRRYEYH